MRGEERGEEGAYTMWLFLCDAHVCILLSCTGGMTGCNNVVMQIGQFEC